MSVNAVLYDEPGPRTRRRIRIGTGIGVLVLLVAVFLLYRQLNSRGLFAANRWDVFSDPQLWEAFGRAALATLRAAAVAAVLAAALGLVLCLAKTSRTAVLRRTTTVVVELFRGLPVVLLMFFSAVILPVSIFWSVVIGLVVYNSAIVAEILRAGIASLPSGQAEAAAALGLTNGQSVRLILLPQAVRRMLPTLVAQLVVLTKDTSLGYIVGYFELLRSVQTLQGFFGSRYLFSMFFVAALMYLILNLSISRVAIWLERRGSQRVSGGVAPLKGQPNAEAAV